MTIYDIANEAGVSASMVSRVMNNKKGVSAEKRALIENLLKKYNFEPNASARGLVKQSSGIIGILMADVRTRHHAEGVYYIEKELREYGYSCIIINTGFSDEDRLESLKTLASRRVEAVVLIGSSFETENVKQAIVENFADLPVIMENGYIDLPNVYSVIADEEKGIYDCAKLLYEKGRRHIVYVNGADTSSNRKKIAGYEKALSELKEADPPRVINVGAGSDDQWDRCYRVTQNILADYPDTDGLIFATDFLANAGNLAAARSGRKIPDELGIIGVDNSIYSKIADPPITSLDNKLEELSITCAQLLVRILEGEKAAKKMMLLSDIVERETT